MAEAGPSEAGPSGRAPAGRSGLLAWRPGREGTEALLAGHVARALGAEGTVEVRDAGGGKGKGAFAVRAVRAGEPLFRERPLVAMQHLRNRRQLNVCQHCFAFVGPLEAQVERLLRHRHGEVGEGVAARLAAGLPLAEGFRRPGPVGCRGGCDAAYCSAGCADRAWEEHHCLLCPGAAKGKRKRGGEEYPGDSPLAEFYEHADLTNDIFVLAATALAKVLARAQKLQGGTPGQADPAEALSYVQSLTRAWAPFATGHKAVWWDCVQAPNGEAREDFVALLQRMAGDSLHLLKAAIYDVRFAPLFDLGVYSSLVGMFEMNNLALVGSSPVEAYFHHVDELEEGAEKDRVQAVTRPLLDLLDADYYQARSGTAFYSLQSCLNHSCVPNAEALEGAAPAPGGAGQAPVALVSALRDVAPGEELTISYIDEEMSLPEREAALADYGFLCRCPKCELESSFLCVVCEDQERIGSAP